MKPTAHKVDLPRAPALFHRILWPIDAFDESNTALASMAVLLKSLVGRFDVQIQPIYVLGPDQTSLPYQLFRKWAQEYVIEAKALLDDKMRSVNIPGTMEPVVLLERMGSTRTSIAKLLAYAKQHRFHLIATSTHGRRGISKMLFGSFAETLLQLTDIPMLISNSNVKPSAAIKQLVVSVKFPFLYKFSFDQTAEIGRALRCGLRIYHYREEHPTVLKASTQKVLTDHVKKARQVAQKSASVLAQRAECRGAQAECILDSGEKDVSEAIVSSVQKPTQELLVLFGHRQLCDSGDYGATIREIVRQFQGSVLFFPRVDR